MRLGDDIACAELVELVTLYFEGALSTHDRTRFEEHVTLCDGCDSHLRQMKATIDAVGRLAETDLEPEAADELLAAFRGWKGA